MASNDVDAQLIHIRNVIKNEQIDASQCSELTDYLGKSIPLELCSVLHHTEIFHKLESSGLGSFFWDSDIISYEELLNQYKDKKKKYTFFGDWEIDDDFNIVSFVSAENAVNIDYSLDAELTPPYKVENVKNFIPIFHFEGNYILYGIGNKPPFNGLLSVSDEGFGTMLAPDFISHIDDLLEGMKSGRYVFNEGRLMYPYSWFNRKRLKVGQVTMDSYGEITDQNSNNTADNEDIKYPAFIEKWLDKWR